MTALLRDMISTGGGKGVIQDLEWALRTKGGLTPEEEMKLRVVNLLPRMSFVAGAVTATFMSQFAGNHVPEPQHIARARLNRGIWEGHSAADSTWEPLDDFKAAYPQFQLEDELFRKEGGSVVDAFVGKQYSRRFKKSSAAPQG